MQNISRQNMCSLCFFRRYHRHYHSQSIWLLISIDYYFFSYGEKLKREGNWITNNKHHYYKCTTFYFPFSFLKRSLTRAYCTNSLLINLEYYCINTNKIRYLSKNHLVAFVYIHRVIRVFQRLGSLQNVNISNKILKSIWFRKTDAQERHTFHYADVWDK